MLKYRTEQGAPIYIYYKRKLVIKRLSVAQASLLLDITRANVRRCVQGDSYLNDFKFTMEPILGAPVKIIEVDAFKVLLSRYREPKLVHLYIGGSLIGSYRGIKEVMKVTGYS